MAMPSPRLWLHHSAGAQDAGNNEKWADDVNGIQDFHMDERGWSDIAYSFLADETGQLWEGRGAGVIGGHTKGQNATSHGICAIGNYEDVKPTPELLESLAQLVAHGVVAGWWATEITGPHKDAPGASTKCCGRHLAAKIPTINDRAGDIVRELEGFVEPNPPAEPPLHDRELIEELYLTFAGRPGDEAGIVHWMHAELTEQDIAYQMLKLEGMARLRGAL